MDTKREIMNNVIIQMSSHLSPDMLSLLEQTLADELANVSMEEISTLPEAYHNSINDRNAYIIQLFWYKKRLDEDTKKAYLFTVKNLLLCISHKSLDKMDGADIQFYINKFSRRENRGRPLEPTTTNNERRKLSAFFKWMVREGLISRNPVDSVEPVRETWKPIDFYDIDELLYMRDACKNVRERAILEVLRSTGARAGEIVDIRTEQVNMKTGAIPIINEKGGRWITLYVDRQARHYLREYFKTRTDDSPYLFPQARAPHGRMGVGGLRSIVKSIGTRAGITSRVYTHKFRKTLGMTMLNSGYDMTAVSATLGHANTAVTAKHYAQLTPESICTLRSREVA